MIIFAIPFYIISINQMIPYSNSRRYPLAFVVITLLLLLAQLSLQAKPVPKCSPNPYYRILPLVPD